MGARVKQLAVDNVPVVERSYPAVAEALLGGPWRRVAPGPAIRDDHVCDPSCSRALLSRCRLSTSSRGG